MCALLLTWYCLMHPGMFWVYPSPLFFYTKVHEPLYYIKGKLQLCYFKESLHMISMTVVFFEINQIHSLGCRQVITKEKKLSK